MDTEIRYLHNIFHTCSEVNESKKHWVASTSPLHQFVAVLMNFVYKDVI